ncbi:hypothetical protein RHSIM_Rhsim10G0132800 [Rhododendron simsii]|uniref:Integrase catalytic domain-containing protein n=1 Tax=Rhododendron simsii TaxID=118357 RepID=A0A834GCV0_RHOSS|nr:hypothetical protein RHSIM_Rhsim10G0132800 [Rhododendron simsii]
MIKYAVSLLGNSYLSELKLPRRMIRMQNGMEADDCDCASQEDEHNADSGILPFWKGIIKFQTFSKSSSSKVASQRSQDLPIGYRPVLVKWKDLDKCNVCDMDELHWGTRNQVHDRSCGTGDVKPYKRLQLQGYYWSAMAKDAAEIQRAEVVKALEIAHKADHQGGAKLDQHLLHMGYYWPMMEEDAKMHVRRCKAFQVHGNMIHAPAVDLRAIGTPWEFIICRFGIPKVILSDNRTPFVNRQVGQLLVSYDITHHKSTAYHPKGNGQAKATYKLLFKILCRTLKDHQKNWAHALPMALWAYRTSKRRPTQMTPFTLVYGTEVVLPLEIVVPSAQMALPSEVLGFPVCEDHI